MTIRPSRRYIVSRLRVYFFVPTTVYRTRRSTTRFYNVTRRPFGTHLSYITPLIPVSNLKVHLVHRNKTGTLTIEIIDSLWYRVLWLVLSPLWTWEDGTSDLLSSVEDWGLPVSSRRTNCVVTRIIFLVTSPPSLTQRSTLVTLETVQSIGQTWRPKSRHFPHNPSHYRLKGGRQDFRVVVEIDHTTVLWDLL